ncbi:hypothetical protein J0H58_27455 [bacterium]|nr:hypothetical protein [bacterium]
MPNHLKFCGCPTCRSGMRARGKMAAKVLRAVRRLRRAAKLALRRGEEPPPAVGVERTD